MSSTLKIGMLIGYIVIGLAIVAFTDKVSLTEFTTGLGIYIAAIISYKEAFEIDKK